MVTAARLSAPTHRLLDPAAAEWASAREETLKLEPAPIGSQPSEYVINAWTDRPYGLVRQLRVAAAHNGEALFFRLGWQDDTKDDGIPDSDRFGDAAALLFPLRGDAPLQSMGSPEQPVAAWYWRADLERPISITASGLGTTARQSDGALSAAAAYGEGGWRLVISWPFPGRADEPVTSLRPGRTTKAAFAVWQGANQERAGIKAVTLQWQPLEIEE